MVEFDRAAFIGKFQEEAGEYLQRLNEGVIMLEGDPGNAGLIDQMLRDAHTLKGSSRMVGLIEISDVAHRLEDFMVRVRDGEIAYTPAMSDPFFEALDAIVFLSENAGKPEASAVDVAALNAKLTVLAETGDAKAAMAAGVPDGAGGGAEGADSESTSSADASSRASAQSTPSTPPPVPAAPAAHSAAVAAVAPAVAVSPSLDEEEEEAMLEAVRDAGQGPVRVKRDDKLQTKVQHTIRIRTEQLDKLLNLISEVVIAQIKADQRVHDLRLMQAELTEAAQAWARMKAAVTSLQTEGDPRVAALLEDLNIVDGLLIDHRKGLGALSKDYAEDTSRASTVVSDLQEQGMRLRMLPVSTVFNSFPHAVRDLARDFKKEVDLVIEGGETELDKKVLEEINDPLVHIMRNAIDHGLETPDVRQAAGKPRRGTIRLAARQEGDHILIEVSDDGRGIDPDAVRAAAVRKGYVTANEAEAMSDREATYLIFEKGFSTAAIITEISGRGVGMDVVREFVVEKLKGSLDVASKVGQGTTFRLTIPLTLAIIRALMLRVGGQTFALPTTSIEETLRIDPSEVIKVEGREVVRRQRRTIALVRLGEILGIEHQPPETKLPIAIVGFSGHRMGFIVDAFAGEQQIVIKNLGSHLQHIDNVAGVTILGAGKVVPIINVPDLMTNARQRSGLRTAKTRGQVEQERKGGPKRILICEDSFTTRELERSIFEAAGYEVEVAMDGAMGFNKLREGLDVDAVVTDVQMPNMDGFELTRSIKSDENLSSIPVIIVTSLEREEEKAIGIEAGADAYITKSVFNQDTLLDTVERLIR